MRGLAVVFGLAVVVGCGGGGHGNSDGGGDGSGHGYTRVTDGPIYCLVSADCPDGEHCELGACKAGCTTDSDCPGRTCGPRGRCVEATVEDVDTPPPPTKPAELSISPQRAVLDPGVGQVTVTLTSTPAAAVEYRVQPRVPWLSVADQWGHFDGTSTTFTVNVDRSLAGPGTHVGEVGIISSIGSAVFQISFSEGLTGRYVGTLEITDPKPIGSLPFGMDLLEDSGYVRVLVLEDRSPHFPTLSVNGESHQVVGSGRMTGTTLTIDFDMLVPKDTLAAAGVSDTYTNPSGSQATDPSGNPFARDVGRQIRLTLTPGPGGNLSGQIDENIYGVFPDAIQLKGAVQLVHVGLQQGESVAIPPEPSVTMPTAPATTPPVPAANCLNTGIGGAPVCTAGSTGDALLVCAQDRAQRSYGLESPAAGWNPEHPLATIGAVADACATGTQGGSSSSCFNQDLHNCAVALAFLADQRGTTAASPKTSGAYLLELLTQRETLNTFIANDYMVRSYTVRLGLTSNGTELTWTQTAAKYYRDALVLLYQPYYLDFLTYVPSTDLVSTNYDAVTRMARAAGGAARATAQRSQLDLRYATTPAQRDTIRKRLQVSALMGYFEAAAAARILQLRQGPPLPDLGTISSSAAELASVFRSLTTDLNPLGFTPQYIQFLPKDTSISANNVNFQLVAAAARTPVEDAVAAEAAAKAAWTTFMTNQSNLATQQQEVEIKLQNQLKVLCGTAAGGIADLDNCEFNEAGQAGIATLEAQVELEAMKVAQQRLDGQKEKIVIEVRRAAQIKQVHEDNIEFLDDQGEKVVWLDLQMAVVNAAEKFIDIASRAELWNAGAPLGEAAVMAGLELIKGGLQAQQTQLQYAEKIHAEASAEQIDYINSMAQVKNMLIDEVTMSMEVGLAALKVVEARAKVLGVLNQRDALLAEIGETQAMVAGEFSNDPSWRMLRDQSALDAIAAYELALRKVYLATRALEYETNMPFPPLHNELLSRRSAAQLKSFVDCLNASWTDFQAAYTGAQTYAQVISLRDDVLGIKSAITDPVTGQTLSPAEQFRRRLLSPLYLDDKGGTGFEFATNLGSDGLFSSLVCNDRIVQVKAKLVGDFLGDNQVQLEISQQGASFVRSCKSDGNNDIINEYKLDPMTSQAQGGVNDWGTAPPNTTLASRSVAAARWIVRIPGGSEAPMNRDVNLDSVDDIVIELTHSAIPLGSQSSNPYNPQTCP